MTTQVRTFPKKTVYHSALRQESERDGLAVKFTTEVLESTYPDRPPYIRFEVYGDSGGDYAYNIENEDIAAYLRGLAKGEWFVIRASGSRDTAVVEVEAADGEIEYSEVPPDQPEGLESPLPFEQGSAHQKAAQANQERAEATRGGEPGSGMGNAYLAALRAAAGAVAAFREEHGRDPTDDERVIATTIFIQMNR